MWAHFESDWTVCNVPSLFFSTVPKKHSMANYMSSVIQCLSSHSIYISDITYLRANVPLYNNTVQCTVLERYEIKEFGCSQFIAPEHNIDHSWVPWVEIFEIHYWEVYFLWPRTLVFYPILTILAHTYVVKLLAPQYNQKETSIIKCPSLVRT